MPIYEYTCKGCGHHFDKIQSGFKRAINPACPSCQGLDTERAFRTAPKVIMRPEGYNLHPEDPGYSHFTDLDRRVIRD